MACFISFFLYIYNLSQEHKSGQVKAFATHIRRPGDIHLSVFLSPVAVLCWRKCAQETKAPFTLRDVPGMEIESFSPELLRAMNGQRIRATESGDGKRNES